MFDLEHCGFWWKAVFHVPAVKAHEQGSSDSIVIRLWAAWQLIWFGPLWEKKFVLFPPHINCVT
jgi:hypothetical protein